MDTIVAAPGAGLCNGTAPEFAQRNAATFEVRFWGVRGTVAVPGPATMRYGGNTACVELRCGDHRLILDAGTGIRALGDSLAASETALSWDILLTHTHHDHVGGFPYFCPAYSEGHRVQVWAGHLLRRGGRLRDALAALMREPYFPVPLEGMHACAEFRDFAAGDELHPAPGVRVETVALNHPGGATGYRIDYGGRSVCYVTDVEHVEGRRDSAVLDLIQGSQLVIYDATFTDQEFPRFRGWGHSTWQEGVRLCEAAGAGRLVLFHHHPRRDDRALDALAAELERVRAGSLVACEGLVLDVQPPRSLMAGFAAAPSPALHDALTPSRDRLHAALGKCSSI